ncbi:MAG TPA: FUSC family protein [Thermoplasmata archaeon]|nr:FUSC family protein [Thermoplasmata archaeon]
MSELAAESAGFLRQLARVELGRFDLLGGLRTAVLVLVPFAIGIAFGWGLAGVVATLGTLNVVLVMSPPPAATPIHRLAVAAVTNALAFGAGAALVLLPTVLQVPLAGAGVLVALLLLRDPRWDLVGLTAAVMFVVAIGLPVSGLAVVPYRGGFLLAGGLWGVAGLVLLAPLGRRYEAARWARFPRPATTAPLLWREVVRHALLVGATVAAGLVIGLGLHLERDPWIMLTVIVALRLDLRSTLAYAVARIAGTIAGAGLAFVVTETIVDPAALLGVLAVATVFAYGGRSVNYTFFAFWITPVVIVLLNLVYSGGPALAVTRVVDTVIGGGLALLASLLLWTYLRLGRRAGARSGAGEATR